MTHLRRAAWPGLGGLIVLLAAGCAQSPATDSAGLKAKLEATRDELGRAQAECGALRADLDGLRADLDRLRAEVRARPPAAATNRERAAALPGRLAAAQALASPTRKQDALATLALDAAELGDADVTKKCADQLASPTRKQDVTYQSALRLAAANKAKEAVDLANTLTSPTQKEKALAAIAAGGKPE